MEEDKKWLAGVSGRREGRVGREEDEGVTPRVCQCTASLAGPGLKPGPGLEPSPRGERAPGEGSHPLLCCGEGLALSQSDGDGEGMLDPMVPWSYAIRNAHPVRGGLWSH